MTKQMAMTRECYHFSFALVQHAVPLCLQWPVVQPFPAAWVGTMGQCSVYLHQMSMVHGSYFCRATTKAVGYFAHRHLKYIDCLSHLVCFISTVNGRSNNKRKEKKKLTLGRLALVVGTWQTLSNIFWRLSISMILLHLKIYLHDRFQGRFCIKRVHGQTLGNRTIPGPSLQVQKWLCFCLHMFLLSKTAQLKVENSAQTTFRFSPVRYRAPRLVPSKEYNYFLYLRKCSNLMRNRTHM